MSKNWKSTTAGGQQVRIYAEDARGSHPIHGAVFVGEEWVPEKWTKSGHRNKNNRTHDYDLVPDSQTYDVWLQVEGGVKGFMASPVTGAENNVLLRIDVDKESIEVLEWRKSYE